MEGKEEIQEKRKRGGQPGHPHYRPPGSPGAPKGHPPYEGGGRPKTWTNEKIDEIADEFMEFIEDPTTLYYKEFVMWLKRKKNILIQSEYISRWSETNEKFKEAYDYAKLVQECKIVKGGLLKKLDSSMAKFMLTAVHGFSDKQVIEHQGNDVINVIHYGKKEPKTWKEESQDKQR